MTPACWHEGERVHLGYNPHSECLTEPALQLSHLPPVDLILLSHFHEDHFGKFIQQHLDRAALIVSTRHAAGKLRGLGFRRTLALVT